MPELKKHTPGPWKSDEMAEDMALFHITGPDGRRVASVDCRTTFMEDVDEAAANAAFIVRAVNCHEELLAALKSMVSAFHPTQGGSDIYCDAATNAARAAIAKAERGC